MQIDTERLLSNSIASFEWWGKGNPLRSNNHVDFLERYKGYEAEWDAHLKEVRFLPRDLIDQARQLTRFETRLVEGPLFPGNVDDQERVRLLLMLKNMPENWPQEQLLTVAGLTIDSLKAELQRQEDASRMG